MANLFGNLDTPKWQQPGDDWLKAMTASESIGRNASNAVRAVVSLIGMRQEKEAFDAGMELKQRQLKLDALKTAADISQTAVAQRGTEYALNRKIEADQGIDSWLGNLDGNVQSILDAQLPLGAAAVPALEVQKKAADMLMMTGEGQEKVAFAKSFHQLDGPGRAAVREYWEPGTTPDWMTYQELGVQEQRMAAEEQARKMEIFEANQKAMTDRILTVDELRNKDRLALEKEKSLLRINEIEKRLEGRGDPKAMAAFRARIAAAKEAGDLSAMERIAAEFEGGVPHQEEGFAAAATRKTAESQLSDLANEKLKHQQELAKGDKRDALRTGFKSREARIKEIDKEMAVLQEILSGKASASPAGAPTAAPSGPPRLRWNSSTNSLTR